MFILLSTTFEMQIILPSGNGSTWLSVRLICMNGMLAFGPSSTADALGTVLPIGPRASEFGDDCRPFAAIRLVRC